MTHRYGDELRSLTPETDEERFSSITNGRETTHDTSNKLIEMGAVMFHVIINSRNRIIGVAGQEEREVFLAKVSEIWKFEEPSRYFRYTGGATVGKGWLE